MPANSEFFGNRDAKAVLKHGLLARYAIYFAGRAGSVTSGRVAFIDGYAGEGRYEDGNLGSPLLLANRAKRAEALSRQVRLAFVEQDDARRKKLTTTLAEAEVEPDVILGRSLDDEIDGLLERFAGHAVLLFVDPFGLAISRSTLERILRRRSRAQPIDVIYHFSVSSARRQGSLGVTDKYGAEHSKAQMDAALGEGIWQDIFAASMGGPGEATRLALDAAQRFTDSVGQATGMRTTSVEVRKRPQHLPEYLLTLFSQDPRAHWDFADMAGRAYVDWLLHCSLEDYNANLEAQQASGLMSLFEEPKPEAKEIERVLKRQAADYLGPHLYDVMQARRTARPVEDFVMLYGDMLGRARATHLRSVFNELIGSGMVIRDAGPKWFNEIVRWVGPATPSA